MIVNKRNKMELTPEQIHENWDKLLGIIDKYIASPRKEQLKALYEKYEDRLATMPASGREAFHSCFVGGYVDHILNVIECGLKTAKMWEFFGAKKDWTDEELVFSLMNHDFGKVGDDDGEYYIPNESEWHRKNLGIMYKSNPAIHNMTVPDRGLFLMQENGIAVSKNEYLSIKLHDGLYDDINKPYLLSFDDDKKLKTNLPFIVHQADFLAYRIEYEKWKEISTNKISGIKKSIANL